jgi:hypothetical protein
MRGLRGTRDLINGVDSRTSSRLVASREATLAGSCPDEERLDLVPFVGRRIEFQRHRERVGKAGD